MESLIIKGTDDTPSVNFDSANNKYEIGGRSLPEDAAAFYEPLINWLEKLKSASVSTILFEIKLEYFNTASSKMLLDLLMKLEEVKSDGKAVEIDWFYLDGDDDMVEAGEEYSELVDIKFNLKEM